MRNPSRTLVRILVVDDHEPFRRFLHLKLQQRPELQIVGEASDGLEGVQKAKDLQPDLILLDIGLPRLNGIEAAHRIMKFSPNANILFISQENDAAVIAAATGNGAKGFVRKLNVNRELLPAIEAVLRGEHITSTGVTQRESASSVLSSAGGDNTISG
jgi:two-component system, NarL family, nitrate/nitrite response regulator NarL